MIALVCVVGTGKIAIDQHVPAIGGSDDWELAATVSRVDTEIAAGNNREYPPPDDRMAELVKKGASAVDVSPMIHVAAALMLGKRIITDTLHF